MSLLKLVMRKSPSRVLALVTVALPGSIVFTDLRVTPAIAAADPLWKLNPSGIPPT